jgi:hypothetical protein
MSQLFSLDAQKCGFERHVKVEADGFGITLYRDGQPLHVSGANEAIRVARDYIGEFLRPAQRGGVPWGLRATVSGGVAVYGEWPLVGGGRGGPSFRNSPLVRIRNRWHDSGPLSALENAVQIIREYMPRSDQRLAA